MNDLHVRCTCIRSYAGAMQVRDEWMMSSCSQSSQVEKANVYLKVPFPRSIFHNVCSACIMQYPANYDYSGVADIFPPARYGNHAMMCELFFFPRRLHLCFFCFCSGATGVAVATGVLIITGGLS